MILPNQENSAGNFNCICNESTPGSRIKSSFILQVFCFIHLPEDDLNQIILSLRNINWKFCNHSWVDLHNLCSHIFPLLSEQMRWGHTFKTCSIIFQPCCWNRRAWRVQTEFSNSGNNFISDPRLTLSSCVLTVFLFYIWALIQSELQCLSESILQLRIVRNGYNK